MGTTMNSRYIGTHHSHRIKREDEHENIFICYNIKNIIFK